MPLIHPSSPKGRGLQFASLYSITVAQEGAPPTTGGPPKAALSIRTLLGPVRVCFSPLADCARTATVGLMFMGNPEIGACRADEFYATGLACAVRLASRRFVSELAIDHAGPKERRAAEKRLRQLEG